jgi:hypothetical protein
MRIRQLLFTLALLPGILSAVFHLEGHIDLPGAAINVIVRDSLAYVSGYPDDLYIVNVSDRTNPIWRGNCWTSSIVWKTVLSSSYAFIANGESGLQIVDINNPGAPQTD